MEGKRNCQVPQGSWKNLKQQEAGVTRSFVLAITAKTWRQSSVAGIFFLLVHKIMVFLTIQWV